MSEARAQLADVTFARAMKSFRRGAYQFGPMWRCAVLSPNPSNYVMHDAVKDTEASSMAAGLRFNFAKLELQTANGATMQFYQVKSPQDLDNLRGKQFEHIILVGYDNVRAETIELLHHLLGRGDVEFKDCRLDRVGPQ